MPALSLPRRLRITRARDYDSVYADGVRQHAGPIVVHGRRNGLTHCRLGLSVSRRVGGAVVRHRIKRLLREAFRTIQHELPDGYDLVVAVRPHAPLALERYRQHLLRATRGVHQKAGNQ